MPSTPYIILPSGLTTTLQAVNVLIGALGEAPVTTLSPTPLGDAALALNAIDFQDRALQTQGWSWNREYSLPLARDTEGRVPISEQTLHVSSAYWSPDGAAFRASVRGGFLYDLANHTNVFAAAPVADLIVRQAWEDIPEAARQVITLRAARQFLAGQEASSIKFQVNSAELAQAIVTLEHQEDEGMRYNEVTGNIDQRLTLYGSGLQRRNMR